MLNTGGEAGEWAGNFDTYGIPAMRRSGFTLYLLRRMPLQSVMQNEVLYNLLVTE